MASSFAKEFKITEKVAIVTLVTTPEWKRLAEITLPSQREYARRLGADFIILDQRIHAHPHYDKWQLFDVLDHYDRVLYVDADIIIRPDCPDLFVVVAPEFVAGENELLSSSGCDQHMAKFVELMGLAPIPCPYYLNCGLLVVSKIHRRIFRPPEKILPDLPWPEQYHFNARLIAEDVPVFFLSRMFNDRFRHKNYLRTSCILHYSSIPMQDRIDGALRDLAAWNILCRKA